LEVDDCPDASGLAALFRCVYLDTADGATRMFLSGHQEGGVCVKGLDAGFKKKMAEKKNNKKNS
jgi:hypothetical protein